MSFTALASAGLIGLTIRTGSPAFRFFYRKPLRILGKYSYGFYIFHNLYIWAWIQFLILLQATFIRGRWQEYCALGTNFAVTFLVSKLSYDLIEVKFLRLKKGFEYDSEMAEHKHAFVLK